MGDQREEKALRGFKEIIRDLVILLRKSTGAETVCHYWVNRSREQFVMEAGSTLLPDVMFHDRVDFRDHFLRSCREIRQPLQLEVGSDLDMRELDHYSDPSRIRQITVLPFLNNGETVALTVLESGDLLRVEDLEGVIRSYLNALGNVLHTYLELTDFYEQQQEWIRYENSLEMLSPRLHRVEILWRMMEEMKKLLPGGGVSLVARGMECWVNVLNAPGSVMAPSLGLMTDEKSICYDSLRKGTPEFAIHFNQNPKRLSASEEHTEGATLAIPLMIDDRRHGSVLAYDRNALVFRESVKHKLINLVRVAGLAIRANLGKLSMDEDLLTSPYGSFIPDLWEKALEAVLSDPAETRNTWFGFLTLDDLPSLRSRHRLEELQQLQKTLVTSLNPSRFGVNGYLGFNSDYVFAFLLQDRSEDAFDRWTGRVRQMLSAPVVLESGVQVGVEITTGRIRLGRNGEDPFTVVRRAKNELSEAVRHSLSARG